MKKKAQSLFKNRVWPIFLLAVLCSCSTESGPDYQFADLSFGFTGSKSGQFQLFPGAINPNGELTVCWSDSTLSILAINWHERNKRGDIISIVLGSNTPLIPGQLFTGDSLTSYVKSASIGFDVPIGHTEDPALSVTNSLNYTSKDVSFQLRNFLIQNRHVSMSGSFSGLFENSKGETLTISKGNIMFPNYYNFK